MAPSLDPCPSKPNCVSSLATDESHYVDPFSSYGDPAEAFDRLVEIIESHPRTEIKLRTATYLHAVFRSAILRFADDVEFTVDLGTQPQLIHVRSASRIGYSDLGVNRKRIEKLHAAFDACYKDESDPGRKPGSHSNKIVSPRLNTKPTPPPSSNRSTPN